MKKLFSIVPLGLGLLMTGSISGLAAEHSSTPVAGATISNRLPRRDAEGKVVDAHDGCLHQFGDRYYLYGTAYGTTDGHDFQYWSRPLEFTADGNILPLQWKSNIGDRNFTGPRPKRLSADEVIVESAIYGDLASQNPARIRDVKTRVEQALRNGDGRFTVAARAEGDDPCYGTVKTLKVSYRLNGQAANFSGTDPETVDLREQE